MSTEFGHVSEQFTRIALANPTAYEQALRVLKCPESVTGYREVRYPKMDAARQFIEAELGTPTPKIEVDVKRNVLHTFRTPANV